MPKPYFAIVAADTLGPLGFQVWFETLSDFAHHIGHVQGATYDERVLLDTIGQEPSRYIGALMHLLDVADHEQLHGLLPLGPHAQLEHMLREITEEADPPVSRASIVLEMHAQFAEARDAMKAKWAEL